MIAYKSHFHLNTIIELYAKLTRSTEQIMTLLNQPTPTSSTNPNTISFTQTIFYFRGISQKATIRETQMVTVLSTNVTTQEQ